MNQAYSPFSKWDDPLLVGGLDHFLSFHIFGIIIPTDFHNFSEGFNVNQPGHVNLG